MELVGAKVNQFNFKTFMKHCYSGLNLFSGGGAGPLRLATTSLWSSSSSLSKSPSEGAIKNCEEVHR